MPVLAVTPNKPAKVQNGSQLPESTEGQIEFWKKRANDSHLAFFNGFRASVKEYARDAGMALNKIKGLLRHGEFGSWLEKNFDGSAETARVYMRISKDWNRIRRAKLDKPAVTLEVLRDFVAKPTTSPETKPTAPPNDPKPTVEPKPVGDKPVAGSVAADTKPTPDPELKFYFSPKEKERLPGMLDVLAKHYGVTNHSEAVYRAVAACYREITGDE
jgi:hypothetical protein